ncbi:MAG: protein kinase [Bryobacteraceae bacterium]
MAAPGQGISHYQLLEKLGEGGMGVVYKARDLKLDRVVALKFLAPHLLASPEARQRFLNEARATSRLSHPNIATIYAVEEDGQQVFLALEYLAGGTLRALLRGLAASQRQLPPDRVVGYARDIAQGLAHAHRNGIWHRDVKTGNVMLSSEGIVKLTDFGLAKLCGGLDLTRPNTRLGTVAYMSPEQLRGHEIDHRSDIFSFGIVLYELATGELPFRAEREEAIAHQITSVRHPPLRLRRPDLPPAIEPILDRALEKAPDARYQSLDELVADLERLSEPAVPACDGGESPTVTMTPGLAHPPARRHRRWLLGAAGLVAAALVALLFPARSPAVAEGASVLLADVENRTGDPQLNAVTEILRSQLNQSARFNLVDSSRVRQVLERMVKPAGAEAVGDTAREVAWRAGVPLVVAGDVSQFGQGYVLKLRMESIRDSPAPSQTRYREFEARDKNALLAAVHDGSNWVRRTAGESSSAMLLTDRRADETTTDSWQALELFARAEKLKDQGRPDDALVLLNEAVRIDPHFALACMRLADILVESRRFGEGYRWYERALRAIESRPVSKREELRIRALYAIDSGDFRNGEALFRTYALFYPNDYYPLFLRGLALEQVGREDQALEQFREAEKRDPERYQVQAHLAMADIALGRFPDAARPIARLRALKQAGWADFLEAVSAFLEGKYADADRRVVALGASPDIYWRSRSYIVRAAMRAELGRYREAVESLRDGLAFDAGAGLAVPQADKLLALACLDWRQHDLRAARAAAARALELDRSPQRIIKAATWLARSGSSGEAERLLSSVEGGAAIYQAARHRILGEVLMARGETSAGVAEFRQADLVEPPVRPREYLARALALSGDAAGAAALYQRVADTRNLLWHAPDEEAPGLCADALYQSAVLASALGRTAEARAAAARYLELRQSADPGSGELAAAKKILEPR